MLWNRAHNYPSRSSKVIYYGTNRKPVYDFLFDFDSNLGPILPRFRDIRAFVRRKPLFQHPTPIMAKIPVCSPWSRPVTFGLQIKRTSQANWWWNYFRKIPTYVITIHQRYRQTDRQTTCDRNTALCTKVHRAVNTVFVNNALDCLGVPGPSPGPPWLRAWSEFLQFSMFNRCHHYSLH